MAVRETLGIRFLPSQGILIVEGEKMGDWFEGIKLDRVSGTAFFTPYDRVSRVRLTSLKSALSKAAQAGKSGGGRSSYVDLPREASLVLADVEEDKFDSKYSPPRSYFFDLSDGRLLVCVDLDLRREDWTDDLVRRTVIPLLDRLNCTYVDSGVYGEGGFAGLPSFWSIRFEPRMRNKTVADAGALAVSVERLMTASDRGELQLDADSAWDLLRAGHATTLYGQGESAWLEAKSLAWDLTTEAGKIEFAQDLARFGNGDVTGLLIVGLATKKVAGVDSLTKGPGQHFDRKVAQRHHKVLDQRLYPPLDGLLIEIVPDDNEGELLCFYIPKQPDELKPFLVHGVIVGSKVEGAFFSVVRRRGEHSLAVTPQALHAQIATGRALLRSNPEPRQNE
jgi:hypothetical protein